MVRILDGNLEIGPVRMERTRLFDLERPVFLHPCALYSEIPFYISTTKLLYLIVSSWYHDCNPYVYIQSNKDKGSKMSTTCAVGVS